MKRLYGLETSDGDKIFLSNEDDVEAVDELLNKLTGKFGNIIGDLRKEIEALKVQQYSYVVAFSGRRSDMVGFTSGWEAARYASGCASADTLSTITTSKNGVVSSRRKSGSSWEYAK